MLQTSLCLPDLPRRQELAIDLRCSVEATGNGRVLRDGIVAGQTGKFQPRIDLSYRFQKGVSVRNMSGYPRWSRRPCISFEMYQDHLASKADTPSKLYHIDLKDCKGWRLLKIPKRNPTFVVPGNRQTY